MDYFYYQIEGGDERWRAVPSNKLEVAKDAMFITVLSLDSPVTDNASKEQLADIKYAGPLYFDFDSENAWDTAKATNSLIQHLISKMEVREQDISIYASGGKGFHVIVPQQVFMIKPTPLQNLPLIYKEMAYELAQEHMDFRVYTARKGRMFRQANVKRPNGLYKVRISAGELQQLAGMPASEAKEEYARICSTTRIDPEITNPETATELLALFDAAKSKVTKTKAKAKKRKPVKLPARLPSFDALLKGEGINSEVGFHQISLQVAITAHQRGMAKEDLLAAAAGLCESHDSDSTRYNTASKRREELARMWDYTEDNPCYEYSPYAIAALLTHKAPDLHGLEVDSDELDTEIPDEGAEYDHAGVILTRKGVFMQTEDGPKQVSAIAFDNVTELVSVDSNQVSVLQADITVGGVSKGKAVLELESFNSVAKLNSVTMKYGQSFSGSDVQARGLYMRVLEKGRKSGNRMYCVSREGLDVISIPFHEDEDLRKPFMIWSDVESVSPEPRIAQKNLSFKFVGYPDERGSFECDLSQSPPLVPWLKADPENVERLKATMKAALSCQKPGYIGKLLGWMVACHYRMLFHKAFTKFPLLHINGAAGSGKTETTQVMSYLHYYNTEPKMVTPSSTFFPIQYAAAGSCSVPLIIDEFKPQDMHGSMHDRFRLLFRDAYNCREMSRGGGTRDNSDYRSVHTINLAAPICFIAEAAESESAVMERVILLTMVKPAVIEASVFLKNFLFVKENKDILSMIGHYMSASLVRKYSIDQLKADFAPIYEEARMQLMLQPGEADKLTPEQYKAKSNAKERTVFNYAVAKFGLLKLKSLVMNITEDAELGAMFDESVSMAYDAAGAVQSHTQAEWLKVLNAFGPMSRVEPDSGYHLKQGIDYEFVEYNGQDCMEIYTEMCYFKYRQFCGASRERPLFPSSSAFAHAMDNLPATLARGQAVVLEPPSGVHILSLAELRSAGFMIPHTKNS